MTATGARSAAPPDELVARFKAALDRLWPEGGKLGLAVSGGPDSLAMLLLAQAAIPGRFEVATVNHGLRPESAEECALVTQVCAARSIPCATLEIEVEPGNLQANARAARYDALAEWANCNGMEAIATAHHAEDQVETLLMRLNRGSGVTGLAGILDSYDRRDGVFVIRPLLDFRRAELMAVVIAASLRPVSDPSNLDDRFDRARIRNALTGSNWIEPAGFVQSGRNLCDSDDAIAWSTGREWREHVSVSEGEIRYVGRVGEPFGTRVVPREIARRIIGRAVERLGGQPRGQDLARLADSLMGGEGGNLGGVLATVEGDEWVFRPEPPRRSG